MPKQDESITAGDSGGSMPHGKEKKVSNETADFPDLVLPA